MAFGDLKGGTGLTVAANSITNPTTITLSVAVNVGDLIFAVIGEQTSLTSTACGDNLHGGSTYTQTNAGTLSGAVAGHAFYKRVTVAGTLTSISFVATASTANVAAAAVIFEGPFDSTPLDANPANNTDNTSSFDCPATGTLTQASEVVVGWSTSTGSAVWTATSPNLLGPQIATQAILSTRIGYQTVAATTTVTPAFAGTNPTTNVLGTNSFKQDLNIQRFQNTQILSKLVTKRRLYPRHKNENDVGGVDISETARVRSPFSLGRTSPTTRVHNRDFSIQSTIQVVEGSLSPDLYTNTNTFYDPTISSTYDLTPSLYTNNNVFQTPVVNQEYPSVGFTPPVRKPPRRVRLPQSWSTPVDFDIPSTGFTPPVRKPPRRVRLPQSVSTPYSTIDFNLSPSLYTNTNTFYDPVVSLQELPASALPTVPRLRRRIRFNHSVGTPRSTFDFDLAPSLYTDVDTFYTPVVTYTYDLIPSLYVDDGTFYTHVISVEEIPVGVVPTSPRPRRRIRYNHSVNTPYSTINFDITPDLYVDDDIFYTPTVVSEGGLSVDLYVDVDTFYDAIVTLQEITLRDTFLLRRNILRPRHHESSFSSVAALSPTQDLVPSLYVDVDTFYTSIVSSTYNLTPDLYTNNNVFYTHIISLQEIPLQILETRRLGRHRPRPTRIDFNNVGIDSLTRQDLFPSLYTDIDTFYTHVVTAGAVDLAPSLYIDTDTFYSATVSGAGNISPALYIDGDIFYSPTVTLQDISTRKPFYLSRYRPHRLRSKINVNVSQTIAATSDLVASLYTNTNVFYTSTVEQLGFSTYTTTLVVGRVQPRRRSFSVSTPVSTLPFDQTLSPSLYVDADTFYTTILTSTYNLQPALFTDTNSFYSLTVSTVGNLVVDLYVDVDTFYSPTVTGGVVTLQPGLYVDDDTFYTHTLIAGAINLVPSLYIDADTFYSSSVVLSNDLTPSLYTDIDTFYTSIVATSYSVSPSLYTNTSTHYESFLSGGTKEVFAPFFENTNIFYQSLLEGGAREDFVQTIFGGTVGPPPPRPRPRVDVVVGGVLFKLTISIIPGRAIALSTVFIPGRVQVSTNPIIKSFTNNIKLEITQGDAVESDPFEGDLDVLSLIISEVLLESDEEDESCPV